MSENMNMFEADAVRKLREYTLKKAALDACDCPVCGQNVKVYHRTVNATMARQLIISFQEHGTDNWFHISTFKKPCTDWAVLRHFGFIESRLHIPGDDGKKDSGYWRITQKGEDFVLHSAKCSKYVVLYNGKFIDFGGGDITILEALKNKFNYLELMEKRK